VTAAQGLVTRLKSPLDPAVLSFTAVQAGEAFNVIPQRAVVRGTLRTYDAEVRRRLKSGLESLASGLAASFGATATYRSLVEHGPVRNDAALAQLARDEGTQIVGAQGIIAPRPLMVGEDFGLILERVPGAMILLGCGNALLDRTYPHHHPRFDIDERVLPLGVELMARCALRYLG
jgi:amidohydrolase